MHKPYQYTGLSDRGILVIRGPDAQTFLQGQLTCDMRLISPTQSGLGAHCNLQGRVHSLSRIIQAPILPDNPEHTYYLLMPKAMIPLAAAAFKKYALFSKVVIEPLPEVMTVGVIGAYTINKGDILGCYQSPGSVEPRYEMVVTPEKMAALQESLAAQGTKIAPEDWECAQIKAHIPEIYPETMDQFLPHHIGLVALNAVSFEKGCYLGQEIVARMQWRGNIKKGLTVGTLPVGTEPPKPGTGIYTNPQAVGEPIGEVVRVACVENSPLLVLLSMKVPEASQDAYCQSALITR